MKRVRRASRLLPLLFMAAVVPVYGAGLAGASPIPFKPSGGAFNLTFRPAPPALRNAVYEEPDRPAPQAPALPSVKPVTFDLALVQAVQRSA